MFVRMHLTAFTVRFSSNAAFLRDTHEALFVKLSSAIVSTDLSLQKNEAQ